MAAQLLTLREIVESGLCIGCGLCAAIADDVEMRMTSTGVERPTDDRVADHQLALINRVCPGLIVEADHHSDTDPMWGPHLTIAKGHASDPAVRHLAATGGVLTALSQYLIDSGQVRFVLHVKPDGEDPLRWVPTRSRTAKQTMDASGSRYGPVAPLTGLLDALELREPFAVVAKPCDIAAIRNLGRVDKRVDELVVAVLAMACGGASRLTKTWSLLADWSIEHSDVASLRYRGNGNPGPTVVTTRSGKRFETSYLQLWEDEGTWDLQWRCKICPDGMGEVADLVSLDCWPGGAPDGEDAGFNGIIARTEIGQRLLDGAVASGFLTMVDDGLPVDILEEWQPHQSRRKQAVAARLSAMAAAGLPTLETVGLHVDEASHELTPEERQAESDGATDRIRRGLHRDPMGQVS